jgi:hypothetical protein
LFFAPSRLPPTTKKTFVMSEKSLCEFFALMMQTDAHNTRCASPTTYTYFSFLLSFVE